MSQKKQIFKLSILRKFLNDANSCVSLVQSTRLLALPPFFLNDMKSGIFYLLNSILKKYDRSLDGIVMGYQNVKILMDENTGIIPIGSAETEVNVSVEFYIFQPKIGNTLEGVINKKSNNHIGCLVHRYFNATILKPEDVDYENWNCKGFDVNDKIVFKVKDLDFSGLLPYIEGVISNEDSSNSVKSSKMDDCDVHLHNDFHSKAETKRKSLKESSSKSKKGLPQHDELFYSTQLEPNSECKMDTSCSPILKRLPNMNNDEPETSAVLNKVKKKDRKRKAEEFNETTAKKLNKEQTQITEAVDFMDEFIRQELNKVEEELNMCEKEKKGKRTKESDLVPKKLMKEIKNDIAPESNEAVDSDSISKKKKKKKKKHKENEKFKNGSMYDVETSPEKGNINKSRKNVSDLEKSEQTSVEEKVNGVTSTKKYTVQTLLDQFFLEEGKKLKSSAASKSVKESTEQKKERKPKTPSKETEESLYEKLLREARSRIEVREDSPPKKKRKAKSKLEVPRKDPAQVT